MRVTYVRFFQAVAMPFKRGGNDLQNYATDKDYDLALDGMLLTIKPKGGAAGDTILTTMQNVQYMKVVNEPANTKAKESPSPASGKTKVQAEPKE